VPKPASDLERFLAGESAGREEGFALLAVVAAILLIAILV
jgi:hypothetical protein